MKFIRLGLIEFKVKYEMKKGGRWKGGIRLGYKEGIGPGRVGSERGFSCSFFLCGLDLGLADEVFMIRGFGGREVEREMGGAGGGGGVQEADMILILEGI